LGCELTSADREGAAKVAIVDENAAHDLFSGSNLIDRHLSVTKKETF